MLRQPVHVVYGGADRFRRDTTKKLGELAAKSLAVNAGSAGALAEALGLAASAPARQAWLEQTVYERVKAKLAASAVEDFRIDFEDGYGFRADAEEDAAAVSAAQELAAAAGAGSGAGALPEYYGFRVKSLGDETRTRAVRTLDLFLGALHKASGVGGFPARLLVTLPKVTSVEHVTDFAKLLAAHEQKFELPTNTLRMEILIETPQALHRLPEIADAGGERLFGAHLGAYDFMSFLGITAARQTLDHLACDTARMAMKIAFAAKPIFLSDGATTAIPVGEPAVVHAAWRTCFANITRALTHGFYQGWDLHPAQLVPRYAATYAFFLDALGPATHRLKAFMDKATQATLVGHVFDDAASAQGLVNFFLQAHGCGAITAAEAEASGLGLAELKKWSFAKIMADRRNTGA